MDKYSDMVALTADSLLYDMVPEDYADLPEPKVHVPMPKVWDAAPQTFKDAIVRATGDDLRSSFVVDVRKALHDELELLWEWRRNGK